LQLAEVIDQLKFLLFKSPVPAKTKLNKSMDWEPVAPDDLKRPKKSAPPPPPVAKTYSGYSGSEPKTTVASYKPVAVTPSPAPPAKEKWSLPEKWYSAGGVVVASKTDFSKVYIRKASGSGYGTWSLPKGRIDKGESPPKTALREVEEEIGVKAELVPGGYLGTGEGGFSITHFYLMYAKGPAGRHDKETEKVELVSWADALHTFARAGNTRDLRVISRALDMVEKLRKQGKVP
jgi:8-oxo-dGTP pyrophosphatase MutT (NUDIX family)